MHATFDVSMYKRHDDQLVAGSTSSPAGPCAGQDRHRATIEFSSFSTYPAHTAIKLTRQSFRAHLQNQSWSPINPRPFEFTFTRTAPGYLVEGFKLARPSSAIRVASKQELKDRIMAAMDYFNQEPSLTCNFWAASLRRAIAGVSDHDICDNARAPQVLRVGGFKPTHPRRSSGAHCPAIARTLFPAGVRCRRKAVLKDRQATGCGSANRETKRRRVKDGTLVRVDPEGIGAGPSGRPNRVDREQRGLEDWIRHHRWIGEHIVLSSLQISLARVLSAGASLAY